MNTVESSASTLTKTLLQSALVIAAARDPSGALAFVLSRFDLYYCCV
jgi:hypothetical protein